VLPILVLVAIIALIIGAVWVFRRRRNRKRRPVEGVPEQRLFG
jgi:LPXTG-motif cell wall-anchored protein